jgi:hypothetical protein
MEPKAKFIVQRYDEDISWVKDYTSNYLIINKGKPLEGEKIIQTDNNGKSMLRYLWQYYDELPELMAFLQGEPFEHCKKEVFNILIYNSWFTPLESIDWPESISYKKDAVGGFIEINNSSVTYEGKYKNFDEFMGHYFKNYTHIDWVRFAPGEQYIIEKHRALFYPREFWKALDNEMPIWLWPLPVGHFIERALWTIFQCNLELRETY